MSIEETQTVMDTYFAALVAREDIAPYFSDDVVLELVDVGQRIEGRDEVVGAIVELHEQTFDATPGGDEFGHWRGHGCGGNSLRRHSHG